MKLLSVVSQVFLSFPVLLHHARGYTIDPNCGNRRDSVREAVDEALNIASYAKLRVERNDPQVNEKVFQQFLGKDSKQLFKDRMGDVAGAIGTYQGNFDPANPNADNTVVIDCGTSNLLQNMNDQKEWWDIRLSTQAQAQVFAPTIVTQTPQASLCGATTVAFTYHTSNTNGQGPHSVIVLCDGNAPAALGNTRKIGSDWRTRLWKDFEYNSFSEYMSTTLVHEFMHALRNNIGHNLPSGSSEIYEWQDIQNLSDQDKQANAQGFSALASGFWLRYNTMGESGKMSRKFSQNNRPDPQGHSSP
ncbi:hypothetical protein SLS57_008639 [Botryosphaeria dothidea]